MVTIVIPAAGAGQRFKDAGYKEPKPLIPVLGKPMIQRVVDNITPHQESRAVVVGQGLDDLVRGLESTEVISILLPTRGAVDTILKARDYITNNPLLIANCDQLVDFDVDDFIAKSAPSGSLVTFRSSKPHHSYVDTVPAFLEQGMGVLQESPPECNYVHDIKEKEVISNQAVAGVYYFTKGTDFLKAADEVIKQNKRYNNEFYTSSVIAEMIRTGALFNTYDAAVAILGTPEELQLFEMAANVAAREFR